MAAIALLSLFFRTYVLIPVLLIVVFNTVSFIETPVPKNIDGIAPPYPVPARCAVTAAPAKYLDPQTNAPYATLDAFKVLRGRTGRRQSHSFGGASSAASLPGLGEAAMGALIHAYRHSIHSLRI